MKTNRSNEETVMDRNVPRRRLARRVLSGFAVAGLALLAPSAAHAGEYPQYFCQGPGNTQLNAWYDVGSGGVQKQCNPAAGWPNNGVYYNTQSLGLNHHGGLRFDAPSGAKYKSLSINLRVPYQAQNRRTYIEANSGYTFSWWNGWGGTSSFNPDGNSITFQLLNSNYAIVGQACHGASAAGCEAGDFYFSGIAATLTDTTAPTVVANPAGGMFDPSRTVFRNTVVTTADITDWGHGPSGAKMLVDNVQVGSIDWLPSCNYRLPNPCPARPGWWREIDTRSFPDGTHVVRVLGEDGVGNAAYAERTVTFDNTAPVLSATPTFEGETHSGDAATFPVSATDATSGVSRIEYAVDGGAFAPVQDGAVTVAGLGSHTVVVRAVDVAGNVAERSTSFVLQEAPSNQRVTTTQDQPVPGSPGPGDTIKCDVGSPWSDGTTFAYRWLRDGAVIEGAAGQTYEVVAADAGRSIVCRVIASNEMGSTQRESDPVTAGGERCFGFVGATDPCGDFDQDGQDNEHDPDDDGDGVLDGEDSAPFDPNVPGPGGGSGGTGATGSGATGSSGPAGPAGANGVTGADGRGGEASANVTLGIPNNGVNASNRAKITLTGTRRRSVKFGRRIATVAHLRDETGRPITGAQVTVLERMEVPGAEWAPARQPLVTDGLGRLRWIIPAKYSRTIRYAYKANLTNVDFQSTSDLVLSVLAKSTLRASKKVARNGQVVRFRGQVKSRPIPPGGVLIDLQARVGKRWQTFRTRRARGKGRWSIAYRFTSTRGVRTYKFRARIRRDTGYPYAMAPTRVIRVKVIG